MKDYSLRPAVPNPELVEGSRDEDRKLCLLTTHYSLPTEGRARGSKG